MGRVKGKGTGNMITYLRRNKINDKKWNETLSKSAAPFIYAATYYLDIVCPKWEALILDDYRAIMPLTLFITDGRYCIKRPSFSQQFGIFSQDQISSDTIDQFFKAIPDHFKIESLHLNSENVPSQIPKNFTLSFGTNYELNLNKSFEELKKSFSENLNRNYKKAVKTKLHIIENLNEYTFLEFVMSYSKYSRYFEVLKKLIKVVVNQHHKGNLVGAADDAGHLYAVNFFLNEFNRVINLYPAASLRGRQCGANAFILLNEINKHAGTDKILDFEGGDKASIARFYGSFGAEKKTYYCLSR